REVNMKKILLTVIALSTLAVTSQAALVAHWGFDGFTVTSPPRVISPNDGSQLTSTLTIDATIPNNKLASVAGTTLNDPRVPASASQAVEFQGAVASASGLTIHLSGTGLSTFLVTYAAQRTSSGATANTWSWSTDGTTFSTTGVTQPGAVGTAFATL